MQDFTGDDRHKFYITQVVEENCKFITPKPSHRVTFPDAILNTPGNFKEQLVANIVAQGLIYFFEPVEIEKKDRNKRIIALGLYHHAGEAILQQHSVG
jgi:hypothetical protein